MAESAEFTTCTHLPGGYAATMCKGIEAVTRYHPTKAARGIYTTQRGRLTEDGHLTEVGHAVTYHGNGRASRGILLNYCPFCGGQLRDMSADDQLEKTGEEING